MQPEFFYYTERRKGGSAMVMTLYTIVPTLAVMGVSVYVLVLLIRALRKYLRTAPSGRKGRDRETLGAVLKQHRTACKMTQEFVAESIGVSGRRYPSGRAARPTRAHPICSRWRSCSASTRRSCSMRRKTQNSKTKAPVLIGASFFSVISSRLFRAERGAVRPVPPTRPRAFSGAFS